MAQHDYNILMRQKRSLCYLSVTIVLIVIGISCVLYMF